MSEPTLTEQLNNLKKKLKDFQEQCLHIDYDKQTVLNEYGAMVDKYKCITCGFKWERLKPW